MIIADDEPLALERMAALLANQEQVNVVGTAANGAEALELLKDESVDAAFLDILMPGLSGMDLADLFKDRDTAVVLVSAFDQHAVQAFDLNVTDYLTKPVRPSRLTQAIEKIRGVQPVKAGKLALPVGEDLMLIDPEDILHAQVRDGVLELTCKDRKYFPNWTLKQLMDRLASDNHFVKVSRQAMINARALKTITPLFSGVSQLTLIDGGKIEASRSGTRLLKSRFDC